MANLSRKQREIAERHNHFLAIGRTLLHEQGFHHLSMDRIAELAEYSKGTVYQHFNCKEELLGQLCVSCVQQLHGLAQRAVNHQGPPRERLLAFFIAHDLHETGCSEDVSMLQNFHTDQVLDKLNPSTIERYNNLQNALVGQVKQIVDDAMDVGDLPRDGASSSDIVFALWSLTHGAQTLRSYNLPLKEMGINDSYLVIVQMLERLLDGLGWAPLPGHEIDNNTSYAGRIQDLRAALFKDEILNAATNPNTHTTELATARSNNGHRS